MTELEIIQPIRAPRSDRGGAHDKPDAEQVIREFLLDKTGRRKLTDKQNEIYQRIQKAWSLLNNHMSREQAQTLLEKEEGIDRITAYRAVQAAIRLYGNLEKSDKEGLRYLVGENAHKLFQLAIKKEDFPAAAKALSIQVKCWGLDRDDASLPDFSKLDPGTYTIMVPSEILEKMKDAMSIGTFDLDKMNMPAMDIPFEEVEAE